jgi:hypothetical protein
VAEGVLVWLAFRMGLAFYAAAAGVLWMILWGWSLVLSHGTIRGHTDFWTLMLAVSFFHFM